MRPEGLGKFIQIIHIIGFLTRDFPACSITTRRQRAPNYVTIIIIVIVIIIG
jgi:hypothetical protein